MRVVAEMRVCECGAVDAYIVGPVRMSGCVRTREDTLGMLSGRRGGLAPFFV